MAEERYQIQIEAEDDRAAQQATRALADQLRELPGVLRVERRKEDLSTQDLGTILEVIASSNATLAIAGGIASWLQLTRRAKVKISSKDLEIEVENITPAAAQRIIKDIRK
jgi:hypothetical protein